MSATTTANVRDADFLELDALVVGAGIAGLYSTYRLRALGLNILGVEAGDGVGGTWFWNRYPGCRCDVPTIEYSYSWDPELQQEWSFPESMSAQPDIEVYVNHVADRHDLRKHYRFGTRVTSAAYDEAAGKWTVRTDHGDEYRVKWCVMATGALSAPNFPAIPGLESYTGQLLHTGLWPQDGADLTGKRVGVIGTGSSGIQSIPQIAKQAASLTVFQRTPNYAMPVQATPTNPALEEFAKANYLELRKLQRSSKVGISGIAMGEDGVPSIGGGAVVDLTLFADAAVNQAARENFAENVRSRVNDPAIAEKLIPKDYPFGCKRLIAEIDYFETYNRPNVRLVDLREGAITAITPTGVRTEQGDFDVDVLVFATGFDAMTGPLTRMNITGRDGVTLAQKWSDGPQAYLGLISAGFPNLFLLTGPGSPSVLSNMVVSIEQHVEMVTEMIDYMHTNDVASIDAAPEAEEQWLDHVDEVARGTQYTDPTCNSWYLGSNIAGKARRMMPYLGGVNRYAEACQDAVSSDYQGFVLERASG